MTERDEQQTVFDYAHGYAGNLEPRLKMLHPIKNTKGAGRGPAGFEYAAGVPDMFLACPVGQYHGLYIELKTMQGKVSAAQKAYHKRLRQQGYAVAVCHGAENAIRMLDYYLADEEPPF